MYIQLILAFLIIIIISGDHPLAFSGLMLLSFG